MCSSLWFLGSCVDGVSFVALFIIIVLVLCSIFVLVVFHLIFLNKDKIRDNEHKQTKRNNRNNEQEQRTTHQQQEQRTIANTKKETQVQGTKQKIKDAASNQNTFDVVLVFLDCLFYIRLPNVFFALSSWFLRWWCGVSFVALLIIIVLVLCSIFVLVVFHLIFLEQRQDPRQRTQANQTQQ